MSQYTSKFGSVTGLSSGAECFQVSIWTNCTVFLSVLRRIDIIFGPTDLWVTGQPIASTDEIGVALSSGDSSHLEQIRPRTNRGSRSFTVNQYVISTIIFALIIWMIL